MVRQHKEVWLKPIVKRREKSGSEKKNENKKVKLEDELLSNSMLRFLKQKETAQTTSNSATASSTAAERSDPERFDNEMDSSNLTNTNDRSLSSSENSAAFVDYLDEIPQGGGQQPAEVDHQLDNQSCSSIQIPAQHSNESSELSAGTEFTSSSNETNSSTYGIDSSDPFTWPKDISEIRAWLKEQSPAQLKLSRDEYQPNSQGKKFNKMYFEEDGSTGRRDWLIYSRRSNSLFCFSCCVFSGTPEAPWGNCGTKGYDNFRNTKRGIIRHSNCVDHFKSTTMWDNYKRRAHKNQNLSALYESKVQKEIGVWKEILTAIFETVKFLAANKLPFRGDSCNINDPNGGLFLNFIKFFARYHSPLQEHLNRLKEYSISYLSPESKNEFIELCGDKIRGQIFDIIRKNVYFGIIFDSTPDTSKKEQVCQVIRTVSCSKDGCKVEEYFIDFIQTTATRGQPLSEVFVNKLQMDGLNMKFCRAQGYDNEPKMSGEYNGVQKWISDQYPLAAHTPCAAHSLNLIGKNVCKKNSDATLTMGKIQNLYNFFAGSTTRWEVLTSTITITLKTQHEIRWSNRWEAVDPLYREFEGTIKALRKISESEPGTYNEETMAGAIAQLAEIWNFKFYLSLKIWHQILGKIETCNKLLQERGLDIDRASKIIKGLLSWLKKFRLNGYVSCLKECTENANKMNLPFFSGFEQGRFGRGAPTFDFNRPTYRKFQIEYFNAIVDGLIAEFGKRFDKLYEIADLFNFLWGDNLNEFSNTELEAAVEKLAKVYPDDLNFPSFLNEVTFLSSFLVPFLSPNETVGSLCALGVLNLLHKNDLVGQFPNVDRALRIFLVMPVTIAEGERAFSKLKLIKNFLRSSMGQERLSNLAIISIERILAEQISFDDVINKFATSKCRRIKLD